MKLSARIGAVGALLTITGGAYALCNVDSESNAISVQINSGQGGFTCETGVISTDGRVVTDLYQGGDGVVKIDPGDTNKTLNWSIKPGMAPEGETYPVYLVRVLNNGEGQSCNYSYGGLATSDDNLGNATAGRVRDNDTLVCGSLDTIALPVEEEPEPDIVTTLGNGCTVSVTVKDADNNDIPLGSPDVTSFFTYGLDDQGNDLEQYGVCAGEDLGSQFECIGEDKTIPTLVPTDCPTFNEDGTIEGRCAPIDTTQRITTAAGTTIEPCWNFVNRWCEDSISPDCVSRVPFSFDPRTLVRETASTTQVWQGSPYCYLTQKLVRGRLKDYWVCIEI